MCHTDYVMGEDGDLRDYEYGEWDDWWLERVSVDPQVASGRPVIAGTRVPIYVLIGALAGGDSIKQVCSDYRVTETDLRAALAYAADCVAQSVHALPRR
jgi:uncharacterized protein (DUF433 family)